MKEVARERRIVSHNETFTIVRVAGSGVINNGDAVAIRSANGHYLTAPNGGVQPVGHRPN